MTIVRILGNRGTIVNGNVYGGNFLNGDINSAISTTMVYITDPIMVQKLLDAANNIQPHDSIARAKVQEIKEELHSGKPRVGKLQALYDWLRRNCTLENTLKAIKVFGELLIMALSIGT